MSGKRLLDVVAIGQAVASIGRKSVSKQTLKAPLRSKGFPQKLREDQNEHRIVDRSAVGVSSIPITQSRGHVRSRQKGVYDFPTAYDQPDCNSGNKAGNRNTNLKSTKVSQRSKLNSTPSSSAAPLLLISPSVPNGSSHYRETDADNPRQRPDSQDVTIPEETPSASVVSEIDYAQLFRSRSGARLLQQSPQRSPARDSIQSKLSATSRYQPTQTAELLQRAEHSPSTPNKDDTMPPSNSHTFESTIELPDAPFSIRDGAETQANIPELRESKVPSSRLGRLWQYGGLATSLFVGAAEERIRRSLRPASSVGQRSIFLNDSNMETLVSKLSRMRGAALKLGQMISFQDLKMLPRPIQDVLQRVQDSADYMPGWQRDQVLQSNLGLEWRELFSKFENQPMAAASIGQVHAAVFKSTGMPVAVKIQYPGVADSISSDLSNLAILLTASRLLPKGLYLEKTIANARTELAWECDYIREAEAARRFASLVADEPSTFGVPKIIDDASTSQVLTMERMFGRAVTKIVTLKQEEKDWIATNILRLCLRELFEFRYMQTDPNWTNFLFNAESKRLELLDFGASRDYPPEFIEPYLQILRSAAQGDRASIGEISIQLKYLTGHESRAMRDAHIDSVLTLAEPFADSAPEIYDFRDQTITDRVRSLIPIMLRERLAPPPEETYSLHRKLSGAFLLCAKLGSRVPAKQLFRRAVETFESKAT